MFQQLPETLIGTALGTAILPSLSLFMSEKKFESFRNTYLIACRLAISLSIGMTVIMGLGLGPIFNWVFDFTASETNLLIWTLRGFLVGLTGHCLLEVVNRSFYAQQDAAVPLIGTLINLAVYIGAGLALYRPLNAPGISLTDSLAFTVQAIVLILIMKVDPAKRARWFKKLDRFRNKRPDEQLAVAPQFGSVVPRSLLGGAAAALVLYASMNLPLFGLDNLVKSMIGIGAAFLIYVPFIVPEIKALRQF